MEPEACPPAWGLYMKKIGRRLLVLLVIFVLAGAAFALHLYRSAQNAVPENETQYQSLEQASMPLITGTVGGRQVNPLHAYTSERDMDTAETPVMIASGKTLSLNVLLYGNEAESIHWQLRERDGDAALCEGDSAGLAGETSSFQVALDDTIVSGRDYFLDITMTLTGGQELYYYGRVRLGEDLHASEMISYVMNFHEAGYDILKAEQYSGNLEQNSSTDTSSLADVNIHSTVDQLAWKNLDPTEMADSLSVEILEMDDSFGSFLLRYLVTTGTEEIETYRVEEYYSVHWTANGFYLMDFDRSVTELFSSNASRVSGGALDFGIVSEGDVSVMQSEDLSYTVFAVGGELWCFHPDSKSVTKIFTFLNEEDLLRSSYDQSELKILSVEDDGDITFLLYGYMNRGKHEGAVGVSCLTYDQDANALSENFFLPFEGSFDYLKDGISQLSCKGSGSQVYLMVGDSVYTVDCESHEVVMLANRIKERHLVVSDDQTAIAWQLDSQQEMSNRTQILYLDSGDSQILEVDEGDWIVPQGFIDDDCIVAKGHIDDLAEVNAELVHPFYSVVIQNREGKEEARYQYDGVYISSITVATGRVELKRLQKNSDGSFSPVNDDTLIQNVVAEKNEIQLSQHTDDVRGTILTLDGVLEGTEESTLAYMQTELISYDASDAFVLAAVEDVSENMQYYAYGRGHLVTVTESAGDAIAAVFDSMGTVLDSRGRLVWYRTGRDLTGSLSVSVSDPVTEEESSFVCLTMMAKLAGMSVSASEIRQAASVSEAMETFLPGRTLNLTGAPVKALLYYLDLDAPILVVQEEGSTLLIVGYDQFNVTYYDPVQGTTYKLGQQDSGDFLADGCTILGYIPRTLQ